MPRNPKFPSCLLLVLCLTGAFAASALGQGKEKDKLPKAPKPKIYAPMPGNDSPGFFDDGVTSERSMMVDPSVAIKLCVAHGELKINGWKREEVRVFVKSGRKLKLQAREKSATSGKVNWLWIGNMVEGRPGPATDCVAGETIEIDAPVGSSFDISGRSSQLSVDSIKTAKIDMLAGTIMVRNVTGGISAYTGRGDVMVENSAGGIALGSTTGNIVAVEVAAGSIGDLLKAKTQSGTISMQKVEHREIDASSISGSLLFDGKFLAGGIYKFRTSSGSIKLAIPLQSSCTFTTTYGEGAFHSELPLKVITENVTPQAKLVVSRIGTGDSRVYLTASNGSIEIKKQNQVPIP